MMSPLACQLYDVIGIGFGPANIALAIALEELYPDCSAHFLEARKEASWQDEMMFDNSDIQNHPLRDLVTPRNPQSKYTFTNYLHTQGRLFEHLNLGMQFPFRAEYADYVQWVARHFDSQVDYGQRVKQIQPLMRKNEGGQDEIYLYQITTEKNKIYYARSVVAAPGRTPYVPQLFAQVAAPRVVHLVNYLSSIDQYLDPHSSADVAVVGASQSAVEIILHLAQYAPRANITSFSRRFGFRLKDTSPFTGEVYFPQFVDLFFHASREEKKRLRNDLHLTNYGSADGDVLDQLYRKLYLQKILGAQRIHLKRSADLLQVVDHTQQVELQYRLVETGYAESEKFDLVILATGFRDIGSGEEQERCPALLSNFEALLDMDQEGIQVNLDYSLKLKGNLARFCPCYINGLCESSHGMGDAGSFSLLALRSKTIVESLQKYHRLQASAALASHVTQLSTTSLFSPSLM